MSTKTRDCVAKKLVWRELGGWVWSKNRKVGSGIVENVEGRVQGQGYAGMWYQGDHGAGPERPAGVSILAVLHALSAIQLIPLGILGVSLAWYLVSVDEDFATIADILMGIPAFLLVVGALELALAWGLWKGRGWAWWVQFVWSAAGAASSPVVVYAVQVFLSRIMVRELVEQVMSIVYPVVAGIVVFNLVVVYYFLKPRVKGFFGVEWGPTT